MTDETIEPSLAESREKLRKQVAVAIHMAAMSAGGSVGEKMPPAYAAADAAIEVIERALSAAPPSPRSDDGEAEIEHTDLDEAADDLIDSVQYLQEALEAGEGVYESKWLGGVMRAHEMLCKVSAQLNPLLMLTPHSTAVAAIAQERDVGKRVETGIVQFDDDWPGVFIRGDNAFKYLSGLGRVLELIGTPTDPMDRLAVGAARGLAQLLARSNTQHPEHKVDRLLTTSPSAISEKRNVELERLEAELHADINDPRASVRKSVLLEYMAQVRR